MKKAWFITHDNYIDRRIFFFTEFFLAAGYDVKLFPSFGGEYIGDIDPFYVYRPEIREVLKEYKNNDSINESAVATIQNLIELQSSYFEQHGKYASTMEQLCAAADSSMLTDEVNLQGGNNLFNIIVDSGNYKIIYNSVIGRIRRVRKNADIVLDERTEHAILQHLKKELFDNPLCPVCHSGILISTYKNSAGDTIIRAVNKNENFTCELNKDTGILCRVSNLPFEAIKEDQLNEHSFDYIQYKQLIFDYTPLLTNVKRYLQEEKPDIVYVADLPTLPIGNMIKKVTGCKLIIDCHEWWKEQSILWEPHLKNKIDMIDKYEKSLYAECDVHITVGSYLAESMSKYFNVKFEAIYSCLSDSLTVNPDERETDFWTKRYGIPTGAKVLLFQGSLTTLRNLENLARSTFYYNDNIYLAIVGGGSFEEGFKRILKAEGKEDKVIFAGWVPQKELMKYTINADLGIIPYVAVNEYFSLSLPNKAMELFTACLPIICDKTLKEVAKIVSDNNVGKAIDCSNPEAIGSTVNEILADDILLKTYKDSYSNCRDLFSYKKQSDELSKLLDNNIENWR